MNMQISEAVARPVFQPLFADELGIHHGLMLKAIRQALPDRLHELPVTVFPLSRVQVLRNDSGQNGWYKRRGRLYQRCYGAVTVYTKIDNDHYYIEGRHTAGVVVRLTD